LIPKVIGFKNNFIIVLNKGLQREGLGQGKSDPPNVRGEGYYNLPPHPDKEISKETLNPVYSRYH